MPFDLIKANEKKHETLFEIQLFKNTRNKSIFRN